MAGVLQSLAGPRFSASKRPRFIRGFVCRVTCLSMFFSENRFPLLGIML